MIESVALEVPKRLGLYLRGAVTEFVSNLDDFPEPSENLAYPSFSIVTGKSEHRPFMPYLLSKSTPDVDNNILVKWVVGDYNYKLQLDIWCGSKYERQLMQEKIAEAFSGQFPDLGLSLNLTDYHNIICRYDITSYEFDDSEAISQRKEWRLKCEVLAHCKEIKEVTQYAIMATEMSDENIHENTQI